ncbi:MAG: TIR domain-containing protein [Lentimicrobiaceae bacterium]|nr:TIR domain-containing protein [Lentimicrobiaceae bacterium]
MKKYDVFISYSRKDYVDEKRNVIPDNVVSKIKDALSSAEITYWFDEDGIDHGDDFADKIVANIEASEIFVFLSTINSNSSPWTRKEIACAHEMDKKIIPVRIDASKYDRSVMLRIADLDYLDYEKNPEKGIKDLVEAVKHHIFEKQEQERKKREEVENTKKRELLEKEIKAIKSQIDDFELKTSELEVVRKKLIIEIERLSDETEKKCLIGIVNRNKQIDGKELEVKDRKITELETEISDLYEKIRNFEKKIAEQEKTTKEEGTFDKDKKLYRTRTSNRLSLKKVFVREWTELKEAMSKKHWIVNVLYIVGIIVAFSALGLFLEIGADYSSIASAYFAIEWGYCILKNNPLGFILSLLFCFFICLDFGLEVMIFILPLIIFSIVVLLIRKNGVSAFAVLKNNSIQDLEWSTAVSHFLIIAVFCFIYYMLFIWFI